MAKNISSITLDSTPQKVRDALTQPKLVKLCQFGSDLQTDWKIGHSIRFINKWQDQVFEQWGTVLEVVPRKHISYNLFFPRPGLEDQPQNYFTMHYVLEQLGNKVKLDIIQQDDRPGAVQENPQGEENPTLKALKDLLENEK